MRLREAREEMQYLLRVVDNGNMLTECSSLRTVFDIESIEDSPSVGDKQLGFGCVRIDGNAAKIYERASVGGALVVHPDHASFVFTVTRDMVDDILFACNDIKIKSKGEREGKLSWTAPPASHHRRFSLPRKNSWHKTATQKQFCFVLENQNSIIQVFSC